MLNKHKTTQKHKHNTSSKKTKTQNPSIFINNKNSQKRNNFLQKFLPIQEAGINEIKKVVAKTFTKTTQEQTLEKKTLGF
jgi:hypothetical protein